MRNNFKALFTNINSEAQKVEDIKEDDERSKLLKMFKTIFKEYNNEKNDTPNLPNFEIHNKIETESMKKYGLKIVCGRVNFDGRLCYYLMYDKCYYRIKDTHDTKIVTIINNIFYIGYFKTNNYTMIKTIFNFDTSEIYTNNQTPIKTDKGSYIIYDDRYDTLYLENDIIKNVKKCDFSNEKIAYVDDESHTHIIDINNHNLNLFVLDKEYIEFINNFIVFNDNSVYLVFDKKLLEVKMNDLELKNIRDIYHSTLLKNNIEYHRIKTCYDCLYEYTTYYKLVDNKLVKMFKCYEYKSLDDIITFKDLDDDNQYKIFDFKHDTNIFSEMFEADENGISEIEVYDNDKKSSQFTNQKDLKKHFTNKDSNAFNYCFHLKPIDGANKIKIRFDKSDIFIPYTLDKIYVNDIKDIKLYEHVK